MAREQVAVGGECGARIAALELDAAHIALGHRLEALIRYPGPGLAVGADRPREIARPVLQLLAVRRVAVEPLVLVRADLLLGLHLAAGVPAHRDRGDEDVPGRRQHEAGGDQRIGRGERERGPRRRRGRARP